MIGIVPNARGSNSVGGEVVGDEGAANGKGVAGSAIGSGIGRGEEEMRGVAKEHDSAVAGDIKGEGVVEDDALEVELVVTKEEGVVKGMG